MARVFAGLSLGLLLILAATLSLGLVAADDLRHRHVALAIFAVLLSCLTQIVFLTYLTVTGKLTLQAVHLGHLPAEIVSQIKTLKRVASWYLAVIVGANLLAVGSGASRLTGGGSTLLHVVFAVANILTHAVVLYREYGLVVRNTGLVSRVLRAYGRRRETAEGAAGRHA